MRRATDDDSVHRNALTGTHYHDVTYGHLLERQFDLHTIAQQACGGRLQGLQGTYRTAGLTTRTHFEVFAEQHQGDDDCRTFKIQMGHCLGLRAPQIDREAIGGRRAQRHQQVHVAGACAQRAPASTVEAGAEPELHRRRECKLPPCGEHPVLAEQVTHHRQRQRQRQQYASDDRQPVMPFVTACVGIPALALVVLGGLITGAYHRGNQGGNQGGSRTGCISGTHCGAFGGKIDLG